MSIAEAILALKWDDALRLVLQTDSYYHHPPCAPPATESQSSATPTLFGRACRYWATSSKTRLCVQGCLVGYTAWVLVHHSRTVPCDVVVGNAPAAVGASSAKPSALLTAVRDVLRRIILAAPVPTSTPVETTCYLYESAEAMQLLTKAPMPAAVSVAHAVAGMCLIPLTWIQKESVAQMRFKGTASAAVSPAQSAEEKKATLQRARQARRVHSVCGIATVACMALMTFGGVALRSYSVFSACPQSAAGGDGLPPAVRRETAESATETSGQGGRVYPAHGLFDFGKAIIGFAMPWGAFIPGIMASAKLGKVIPHAVVGGLICKACVAVPLARVLGGVYQRLMGIHVCLPAGVEKVRVEQLVTGELERAYYAGIATATVVIGVWAAADTYKLVHAAAADVSHRKATTAPSTAATPDEL